MAVSTRRYSQRAEKKSGEGLKIQGEIECTEKQKALEEKEPKKSSVPQTGQPKRSRSA